MKAPSNNAINTDGLGQRAFGASPKPAGYGERWASKDNHAEAPLDTEIKQ